MTGSIQDCPCNECVPPERSSDCHSYCERYTEWSNLRTERNAKIQEGRDADNICFPTKMRKRKKGR